MRVLVTGGLGFVGSHLAREFKEAGHSVEVLDDLSTGHRDVAKILDLPFFEIDLRDKEKVERCLEQGRYDACVHAAAKALVAESVLVPEIYYDVNLRGGLVLLEALRKARCRKLIVSSTAACYGAPDVAFIEETSPLRPINPYGHTKAAFEIAVKEACRSGLSAVCLRYFNAAGAHEKGDLRERHSPETHLIPRLLAAATSGKTFEIYGDNHEGSPDGTCIRDFVHVQDLARAHVTALERLDGLSSFTLNLGTGRGASIMKVIATVEHVLGKRIHALKAPKRPGDPPRLVASIELAKKLLGYTPSRDLEQIVRDAAFSEGALPVNR